MTAATSRMVLLRSGPGLTARRERASQRVLALRALVCGAPRCCGTTPDRVAAYADEGMYNRGQPTMRGGVWGTGGEEAPLAGQQVSVETWLNVPLDTSAVQQQRLGCRCRRRCQAWCELLWLRFSSFLTLSGGNAYITGAEVMPQAVRARS